MTVAGRTVLCLPGLAAAEPTFIALEKSTPLHIAADAKSASVPVPGTENWGITSSPARHASS